jgi:hypothetical protein
MASSWFLRVASNISVIVSWAKHGDPAKSKPGRAPKMETSEGNHVIGRKYKIIYTSSAYLEEQKEKL